MLPERKFTGKDAYDSVYPIRFEFLSRSIVDDSLVAVIPGNLHKNITMYFSTIKQDPNESYHQKKAELSRTYNFDIKDGLKIGETTLT